MKNHFKELALPFTVTIMLLISCTDEDTKAQNQAVTRPTIPINASEVRIGTQIWMTKNLNVSRYRNGDPIPQVTDRTVWTNLTTGAWCYYNNDPVNEAIYGKLYNWYAVNDPRGLAPIGYHVPSDSEWTMLTIFLGGENVAGNKMKSTTGWPPYFGIISSNSSGFTGLPGGWHSVDGTFGDVGRYGFWWSSADCGVTCAWSRYLGYDAGSTGRWGSNKANGFSVRCVKN